MANGTGERLQVRLLGELTLAHGDGEISLVSSKKTRALFVYLLLIRRPVGRERLCELFFSLPDDPRAALRWSLSKIRLMLGPFAGALKSDGEKVGIDPEWLETDVSRLRAWIKGDQVNSDLAELAKLALEPPLAGLEIPGLDFWNTWLAAERAEIDIVRARFLQDAARSSAITAQQQRLFLHEANALGAEGLGSQIADPQGGVTRILNGHGSGQADLEQSIRYCTAPDAVRIAFTSTGKGPPLVKAANWLNHLELDWTGPVWSRLFGALSLDHAFIRYDERGNGLSDWDVDDLSFEAFVTDLETVVDRLGLERFPLLGISQGCAVSIEYAARHPDRVSQLILLGGYAAGWRHSADSDEVAQREAIITLVRTGWGQDNPVYRQIFSQTFMPSANKHELDWFNEFQRRTASAANAARFLETFSTIDVRHRLAQVKAPTLVLHARNDMRVPLAHGVTLASDIPNAMHVMLETDSHIPLSREPATEKIIECIRAFLRDPSRAV